MPPKQDSNNKVKKRVRKSITMEVKSKILKLKDRGYSTSSIGRELNLSRTTVQTILKDKEKLLTALPSVSSNSTIIRKRNALIYEMEKLLYNWIQDQTQRRVPLSLAIIQNKALSIINTLQNKRGENNSDETKCFSASRGWFMRFKTRYSLHNIRVQGEAASADHVAAQSFPGILKEIIESGDYSPKQIFNVDETVYRSENPRALKNYVKSTLPVIWKANPKAWVTSILFEEWFTKHIIHEVKQYCSNNNLAYKALLILDNAKLAILCVLPILILKSKSCSASQHHKTTDGSRKNASFKAYYLKNFFTGCKGKKMTDEDLIELEAQVQKEALESQEIASSISEKTLKKNLH
ncbi:tigger transposable element-derived protein 1-like [Achroia grisella]|uniref:tigger transposable element-derived protein 1-like n=1 Tax=Achroia grisella TaxID=688607 RepID=UPI0027D34924|nr:tigger transposable element-derived protein 1-like [Achroia grisella]